MNASCFGFSTAFELSDHYNKPGDRLLQRLKGRESLESWCSKAFPFAFISGDFSAEHSFANLGIVGAEGEHFICLKGALRFSDKHLQEPLQAPHGLGAVVRHGLVLVAEREGHFPVTACVLAYALVHDL